MKVRREATSYLTSGAGHAEVHAVILINLLPHRGGAKLRRGVLLRRPGGSACRARCSPASSTSGFAAQISDQQSRSTCCWSVKLGARIRTSPPSGGDRGTAGPPAGGGRPAGRPQHPECTCSTNWCGKLPDGVPDRHAAAGDVVALTGSPGRRSACRNCCATGCRQPWITRPGIEIVATNVGLSPRDRRRVSNFQHAREAEQVERGAEAVRPPPPPRRTAAAGLVPTTTCRPPRWPPPARLPSRGRSRPWRRRPGLGKVMNRYLTLTARTD